MLADWLGVDGKGVSRQKGRRSRADAVLELGKHVFVVEWKSSGAAAVVSDAAERVRAHAARVSKSAIPLVVVPYMGEVGRKRCEQAGVAWLDLSGNARIVVPGVHILVDGRENRFKSRGRPSSAFAPKASRIARWLLIHHDRFLTQREIALATDIDEGYTSRVVSRLEDENLVIRDDAGAIRPRDPSLLLDAWREEYDIEKHRILRGHVAARSGDTLLRSLAETLREYEVDYAASGLGAAWLITRFAGFRLVTFYMSEQPSTVLLNRLSFHEEARGANVWLVTPNDEGVFHEASEQDGIRCVHPVQVYLDLGAHPERAAEAASELRERYVSWRRSA
ncbi:MAG: type IV toxin-antitoxin system AbiEi family antitoxin [Planctomycetota bacterium]|jgi:hypothetical protein